MAYAVAKALNLKSKKKDLERAAYFFEKVFISNKSNLDALYNLIIVSLKSGVFECVYPHLIERYKNNNKDEKVLEALHKINFISGNISESQLYSSQLIKINPNYPSAWDRTSTTCALHEIWIIILLFFNIAVTTSFVDTSFQIIEVFQVKMNNLRM